MPAGGGPGDPPMARRRRRAAALRRAFDGPARRRRSAAGHAAPGRPHDRRRHVLGKAGASGRISGRSPFAGLAVPPDVTVDRQVLAEPSVDLAAKTWARLTDGTPLVTAEKRGKGWLVLVHTSANTAWSNLALSGLFVDMLRRLVLLGQGVAGTGDAVLPPWQVLDGFGRLTPPPPRPSRSAGPASARSPSDRPIRRASTAPRRRTGRSTSGRPSLRWRRSARSRSASLPKASSGRRRSICARVCSARRCCWD
jgi:hypothetical protein